MEQTNTAGVFPIKIDSRFDYSATRMPKALLAVTIVLLAARVITSLMALSTPPAPSKQVDWQPATSFQSLPPEQGKLVVYQFYARWSDPCKRMDAAAFSNNQVREMVENKFLPVRITDLSHELGKNPQWISDLEKKYRVFALPTLVVVDEKGHTVGSLIGDCSSLTTYRFLTRAAHSQNPTSDKAGLIRPYARSAFQQ